MTNAVSKSAIQRLSEDTFLSALSFLDAQDMARALRTCGVWNRTIGSEDQTLWKELCQRDNIPAEKIKAEQLSKTDLAVHKYGDLRFTPVLLQCIAEYAVSYKESAFTLKVDLVYAAQLGPGLQNASAVRKGACWWATVPGLEVIEKEKIAHWGNEEDEVYAPVIPRRNRWPLELFFPAWVPLRLFIDREGRFKENGDQARVILHGRCLILTCKPERSFDSLGECLRRSVVDSILVHDISAASLVRTMTLAKAAPEWIDADFRELPREQST